MNGLEIACGFTILVMWVLQPHSHAHTSHKMFKHYGHMPIIFLLYLYIHTEQSRQTNLLCNDKSKWPARQRNTPVPQLGFLLELFNPNDCYKSVSKIQQIINCSFLEVRIVSVCT